MSQALIGSMLSTDRKRPSFTGNLGFNRSEPRSRDRTVLEQNFFKKRCLSEKKPLTLPKLLLLILK
jgi:hypothetical protein